MDGLRATLDTVVADYYARFGAFDFDAVRRHWDVDDAAPVYLAEEVRGFLRDWPAIEAYWAETRRGLARLAARHHDLHARTLGPELALATWEMHWDALVAGHARPIGGDVRVSATFRRRAEGWKLLHYVEAPLAPLVHLRWLCEGRVSAEFAEACRDRSSTPS